MSNKRPLEIQRLKPGCRVRYDYGKWDVPKYHSELELDESWSSRSWAITRIGTVVEPEAFKGGIYQPTSPWGLPPWASPVVFDDDEQKVPTWVRTSCLDVIGWERKQSSASQIEMFEAKTI